MSRTHPCVNCAATLKYVSRDAPATNVSGHHEERARGKYWWVRWAVLGIVAIVLALGGLGGGGFIDYVYRYSGGTETVVPLDDIGGWTQLKVKLTERIQLNGGYGIDNPFAQEIRDSLTPTNILPYPGLARNRAAFGNVIYSPSAYLIFSLEYRRLWTNYITGPTYSSDVIGIGAGYSF